MAKAYKDICPCKDCKLRTITCHSVCKQYKEWQQSGIEIGEKPFFEIRKKRRKRK